jgi:hypothetical protein
MVNRIQNRNSGYSDAALFSKGPSTIQNNSVNSSISGATALKLDEQFEVNEAQQSSLNIQNEAVVQNNNEEMSLNTTEGGYLENEINIDVTDNETLFEIDSIEQVSSSEDSILSAEEEYTPKLFSEEASLEKNSMEEEFEIPAFLRRQKF